MTTENPTEQTPVISISGLEELENEIKSEQLEEDTNTQENPTPSVTETVTEEESKSVDENKTELDLSGFTFEEPKEPEYIAEKYLKEWEADWDTLKESQPILYDLLKQIDDLQKDKYNTEKQTYELKTIPEVKAAVVTQQVSKYISENSDSWAQEFTSDILSIEEVKILNKLNKTQTKELETYVESIVPDYVLDRKMKNKTVYNPFIVFKSEIKNKINELGAPKPTNTVPSVTKTDSLTSDEKKKLLSTSGSMASPTNIQTKSTAPSKFQSIIDLGL